MSRSTFRDRVDVCWQRQLRDSFLAEGTPPVPHLDLKRAVVREVSRKLAESVILRYEWLGTMAMSSLHYGLFFGPFCAGVTSVQFTAAGAFVAAEFGLGQREVAYLARGACVHWAPPGSNSKLVSWTAKLVGRATDRKLMIAYADTDAGEIGTIYQACGWAYLGRGTSIEEWVSPSGRVYNQIRARDLTRAHGGTWASWREKMLAAGWRVQKSNPKHRYVCILDKSDERLAEVVEAKRLPYPKRPKEQAAGDHLALGGATPTRPLQTSTARSA